MTTRQEMLDRVRKALGRGSSGSIPAPLPPLDLTGVMPPLAPEEHQAKFEAEWEKVGGHVYRVADSSQLDAVFEKVLGRADSTGVTLSANPLLAELGISRRLANLGKSVATWGGRESAAGENLLGEFNKASFAAEVGMTGVDFVLAETGTLVLSSATERVQVASLAPPVHVALYRRSQLVGSLDEVLARLPISASSDHPSAGRSVVFVTGSSRTADIEQILVRGVHGPRAVHAILVEDSFQ